MSLPPDLCFCLDGAVVCFHCLAQTVRLDCLNQSRNSRHDTNWPHSVFQVVAELIFWQKAYSCCLVENLRLPSSAVLTKLPISSRHAGGLSARSTSFEMRSSPAAFRLGAEASQTSISPGARGLVISCCCLLGSCTPSGGQCDPSWGHGCEQLTICAVRSNPSPSDEEESGMVRVLKLSYLLHWEIIREIAVPYYQDPMLLY